MNEDEIYDVIANAWESNQVAYWICNDLQNNFWSKFIVSNTLEIAAKVSAADLDMDEDIDIVAVGKIPGELVIYGNTNFTWAKTILANNFYGGTALTVIDFDGDNDLDIIAGASYLGELYWFENQLVSNVIENKDNSIPKQFNLFQNFPNPFNPKTIIKYQIPELSFVTLKVYDVLGNEIVTLVNEEKVAGNYEVKFGTSVLTSGIYFYQLKVKEHIETRKMLLLK